MDVKAGYGGVEKQSIQKNSFDALALAAIVLLVFEAYYLRGRGYYGG